jgi:putative peptide zinc metalloprotease protein
VTANPHYPPRLANGTELLGEYKDSGYSKPPSLIRRADGQVVQLSGLLYQVAQRMDGSQGPFTIAHKISSDLGRSLSPGQVCYLIVAKLAPLGILAGQGGQGSQAGPAGSAPTAGPLLSLKARATLLPERAANAAGAFFRPLFHWPVIAAVIAGVIALDCWVFFVHGLAAAFGQVLDSPLDLLLVAALTIASAAFHECGHAAGCRYGGARPGRIGVGIYLVWPAFFTNVTDSYRLGRSGRLRTDLGGIYFNLIFILALAGLYAATSAQILLLVIVVTHMEMLEQLLPFGRFDGYYILSDLVGVPELFAHAGPVLRHGRAGRHQSPGAGGLHRHAQAVITGWVLCVIPVLALILGYLLLHLPETTRALWHSASHAAYLAVTELAGGHFALAAVDAISAALAAASIAGSLFIAAGLTRRAGDWGVRWSAGRSDRRLLAVLAGAGALVCLATLWSAQGQFRGW